jgi:ABC-type branched-subunit amino acid transport system substrate-binding protein
MKRPLRFALALGVPLLLLPAVGASAGEMTEAQARGKRIYMEGKGRNRIAAFLPAAGIKAPGGGFPCVNCHLPGGVGQTEGGVRSADITWFNLTRDASAPRASGRSHPPYDEATVRRAITAGVDPAGTALAQEHPRYGMDRDDLDDLVDYLKVMGSEPVPGVTDGAVRVGILFPSRGPLEEASREVRALLSGRFREANATGGIFNRRLELLEFPFDPSVNGSALEAARAAVGKGEVFCFLANIGGSTDDEAARYLAKARVPVFVPLLSAPEGGYGADRYTFHILASIRDQARVMVDYLARTLSAPANRLGLLYAKDPSGEKGAEGVREQARRHGLPIAVEIPFGPGALDPFAAALRMREERVGAVLYFGGAAEALAFARPASAAADDGSLFLAPAPMVGDALLAAPPGFRSRVLLAAPMVPPDPRSRQAAELLRLRRKYDVGERHRSFQLLAYAGALLLEEGMTRSGRALTREKLVAALGNVWQLPTGVTPPLTYNPNRRVGAAGAAILRVDPETGRLVPAAGWREPQ